MNRSLLLTLALALAPLAYAADPMPPPATPDARKADEPGMHCLRDTGTRIKLAEGQCVASSGRVIYRDELDHRAHIDLARQLRDIHPGIMLGP